MFNRTSLNTETKGGTKTSRQPLVVVLVALSAGIALDRFGNVSALIWWLVASISLIGWWSVRGRKRSVWLLLMSVPATGAVWHHAYWNMYRADEIGRYATEFSRPVCVEAIAVDYPRYVPAPPFNPLCTYPEGDKTRLYLSVRGVRDGRHWRNVSGRTILTVAGHLDGVIAGDRVRIHGKLFQPSDPCNPGDFEYREFERTYRRLCRLTAKYPESVTVCSEGPRWYPIRLVQYVRNRSSAMLWQNIGRQRSGLAAAVLLGAREQLERDRIEAFFHTGTIHLLAISGLHVGILASALFFVARSSMLPPRIALAAIMVLTGVYALLTDARAPVVRAAILVCVVCVAWMIRRQAVAYNSLAAAAIVVLAVNPAQLFCVGAQLSFLAVAVLAWLGPCWRKSSPKEPLAQLIQRSRPLPIRIGRWAGSRILRVVLLSALIWLVTLPLVAYRFHLISPVALALNVFLWVPITLALFSGFAVLLTAWLMPPAAQAFGWFCDLNLLVVEGCVRTLEPMKGSHFWVAGPSLWWVGGFYAGLGLSVMVSRWKQWRASPWVFVVVWVLLGLAVSNVDGGRRSRADAATLRCTFLAVGHGTCVALELPAGQVLLYDAGSLGPPRASANTISAFLWSRGITHINAVILSHADADHFNALPGLLDRFSIDRVYVSPMMFDESSPAIEELRDSIGKHRIPIYPLYRGASLEMDRTARINVLHPPKNVAQGSDNANSLVVDVAHAGRRLLLTGDLEDRGLERLLRESPLDCDVAMAPHHGSRHSDPARFAAWCQPEWVVISGGRRRDAQEVIDEFEMVGSQVRHTARDGAVVVSMGPRGVSVRGWRER